MESSGHKAQQTCLGCRQVVRQDRLVRFVLGPQGDVLVDYRRKLPGRGAYTCIERKCLLEAIRRRQFDRAFKGANRTSPGAELVDALAAQIRTKVLNLVGMARKSGNTVSGSSLVLSTLGGPSGAGMVLLAEDISEGIAEKILGKAQATGVPCFRLFSKETLGQVLGKGERSVVALPAGPLTESVKEELWRYKHIVGES